MIRYLPVFAAGLFLVACNRGIQNEAAVRQGVIEYLSGRTDLNMSQMQVDVTSVSFRQNEADAMVAFRPKGGGPQSGMQLRYTLERKGNRWVVKGKGSGHGAGQMPPGGMGRMPQAGQQGGAQMPPGHPPIGGGAKPPAQTQNK